MKIVIASFSKASHQLIASGYPDKTFVALPFNLEKYIGLVEWAGRCVRDDKRGAIQSNQPKTLALLGLNQDQWLMLALKIQKQSITMLSGMDQIARLDRQQRKLSAQAA